MKLRACVHSARLAAAPSALSSSVPSVHESHPSQYAVQVHMFIRAEYRSIAYLGDQENEIFSNL